MALIDRIKEQAKAKKTRIVFPEGNEPRIIRGVDIVQSQGIADCVKTYANGWRIAAKVFTGK